MKSISSKGAFWIVAWVLMMSLWTSTAPSIVFPVYAAQWHLSKSMTTGVFATYPVALILILLLVGNISDYIGRKQTLLLGLGFLLLSAFVFAVAPSLHWLFIGRGLQGIGVGLTSGAGAAALVEYNYSSNKQLPGSITTITQAVGLFMATIIGAALIKYAPLPLHLSYWVLFALLVLSILLCLLLPASTKAQSAEKRKWKVQGVTVPRGLGSTYILAALAVGAGFANGAVFLSLGAQIAREVVGTQDILIIGTVLSISYLLASVSATIARRLGPVTSIRLGMASIILTMYLLVAAARYHSFAIFIISAILGGLAYGFSAAGGLGIAAIKSPPQYRVQFLSAVFVVCYLFQGMSAYGGGLATSLYGFRSAIEILALIVGAIALITLVYTLKSHKKGESMTAASKPLI
ncbi:MFS transporter [Paenibacillus whitsoniae]|uniref:MFS transporter n=1 Tax=Paenibacillus whitsoniae TaxID=2496558 RepID=A0A3S0A3T4_9BACL|nr:MFS transporter [Paenibacillus whitsoniae]RTE08876.1 MFS transporter [Paenibacillus whitsoniae]